MGRALVRHPHKSVPQGKIGGGADLDFREEAIGAGAVAHGPIFEAQGEGVAVPIVKSRLEVDLAAAVRGIDRLDLSGQPLGHVDQMDVLVHNLAPGLVAIPHPRDGRAGPIPAQVDQGDGILADQFLGFEIAGAVAPVEGHTDQDVFGLRGPHQPTGRGQIQLQGFFNKNRQPRIHTIQGQRPVVVGRGADVDRVQRFLGQHGLVIRVGPPTPFVGHDLGLLRDQIAGGQDLGLSLGAQDAGVGVAHAPCADQADADGLGGVWGGHGMEFLFDLVPHQPGSYFLCKDLYHEDTKARKVTKGRIFCVLLCLGVLVVALFGSDSARLG